jgi:hypothetical protein
VCVCVFYIDLLTFYNLSSYILNEHKLEYSHYDKYGSDYLILLD